ncbi:thioesterase family protein, partial [Acinetobacter baumannii]|nr:thioesterase family protein [Acinetobacter baumannii]
MEKILTLEEAQALIGHVFVYQMPFNQLIGLELIRFEQDYAEIQFRYQDKLVGNIAQRILHGGMIASVLDVSAGLVCVGNA